MKKAVIYARYSAGSGQTDQSIEGQVRECKRYIKQNKMQLVDVYADRHITGRTDRRPEFQRMISDAESDKFDTVVVYTTDRFSRSKYDSVVYKKQLKDLGIDIRYAAENIPEGPEGILLEALMEGWAQYYSEELSRKIRRGMHDTAKKCKATGSTPPIGYKVGADRRYEIDPEVAPHVLHAFEMCLDGCTYTDISRYLADHGVLTGKGNAFNCTAVRRMLTSRRYIGEYKYSDVIIEGGMPVIVPEDLFYMVQEKSKRITLLMRRALNTIYPGSFIVDYASPNTRESPAPAKQGRSICIINAPGKTVMRRMSPPDGSRHSSPTRSQLPCVILPCSTWSLIKYTVFTLSERRNSLASRATPKKAGQN